MTDENNEHPAMVTRQLTPVITPLPGSESFEAGVSIGRSRYLVVFPMTRHIVGLEFRMTAYPDKPTQYEVFTTPPDRDPEKVMQRLYAVKT